MPWAWSLLLLKVGSSNAARIAIIAITTSSSIKVKPAGPPAEVRAGPV